MVDVGRISVDQSNEVSEERFHSSLIFQRRVRNFVIDESLEHAHIEMKLSFYFVVVWLRL